jgi:hypothetical protein
MSFSNITRQAIRRASFASVADLTDAIRSYIDYCQPFTWIEPADKLLENTAPKRPRYSCTRH